MKRLLHISVFLLSFITCNLYSQVYDTIVQGDFVLPDTLNQIDTNNLKQGYWYIYDKVLQHSAYSDFSENSGYKEWNRYRLSSEGRFVNSEKVGVWKYYKALNDRKVGVYKTVVYFKNGDFIEQNELDNYIIKTNKDTTYLSGEYVIDNDTILISCIKNKCVFKLKSDLVVTFYKSEFKMNFYKLLTGYYNRKIRMLKNGK